MKKILFFLAAVLLVCSVLQADIMAPGVIKPTREIQQAGRAIPPTRNAPEFTFTVDPYSIIVNYYDYMIGSYSSLPLRVIPAVGGGGYFMVYHGRRQANSQRRVFYTYLDESGNVISNNEITNVQNHEGFPTMIVDPVSGKPFYAWHANVDDDADLEVEFVSDAFLGGFSGLWNDIQLTADNPTPITAPNGIVTDDNVFIWPTAALGPSPIAGKRRIYISQRNSESHAANGDPSENVYLAFADFDGEMIEDATPLTWNWTSVPEYNAWNVDDTALRRPYTTIAADNAGNVYYVGYHIALTADSEDIDEPDLDVMVCPNYGEGEWTRISRFSKLPTWNPPETPTGGPGYFTGDSGLPYENHEIAFSILNSGHINAVVDDYGRIFFPGIWGLTNNEGKYYPAMQTVKYMIFDTNSNTFDIREVYPQKDPSNDADEYWQPWDNEPPWGEAEYIESGGQWYLDIATIWPFPHWDTSAHSDAMMFHYNSIKVSKPNDQGMMVMVWQDSQRARWYHENNIDDYSTFANTPEIYISVSSDVGNSWSEPIVLNNVETPQFNDIKPMYVYPADQVIFTGMQGNQKVGKIGFMFYNDYTWGSNVNAPAYHPNPDGGEVMFMELQVTFPETSSDDPVATPTPKLLHANYPNPFNPSTTINFDMPKAGNVKLNVYNVKGQLVNSLINETRGFGSHSVVWNGTDNKGQNVPSGLYFYRLETENHSEIRKMMLMK
ncbi:MAG: FlgD immunoglobulin-like domain containing protein [Candidatus Cloacimonadaceae bacterium]